MNFNGTDEKIGMKEMKTENRQPKMINTIEIFRTRVTSFINSNDTLLFLHSENTWQQCHYII